MSGLMDDEIGQAIQQYLQNQNLQRALIQDALSAARYGQPASQLADINLLPDSHGWESGRCHLSVQPYRKLGTTQGLTSHIRTPATQCGPT